MRLPAFGFLLRIGFLLLGWHRGTRALKVTCKMAVAAAKGGVLIVQSLHPMEVPDFEDDLIWQPFTNVYFCTNSAKGIYSFLRP